MSESGDNIGGDQIRQFVERILRLHDEKDQITGDIKDVYAEAKAGGFDKTALGAVVAHLRKVAKNATSEREKAELFDIYLSAYERSASHTHAHARDA